MQGLRHKKKLHKLHKNNLLSKFPYCLVTIKKFPIQQAKRENLSTFLDAKIQIENTTGRTKILAFTNRGHQLTDT